MSGLPVQPEVTAVSLALQVLTLEESFLFSAGRKKNIKVCNIFVFDNIMALFTIIM